MKLKNYQGTSFSEFFEEQMKDKEFRQAWDEFQPEYQVMCALAGARIEKELSQKQLSALSGIAQAEISKIENGNCDSLSDLKLLAAALDVRLEDLVREDDPEEKKNDELAVDDHKG